MTLEAASYEDIQRAKSDLLRARQQMESTISQLHDDALKTEETSKDWLRVWALSLGVANGGGCVVLGNALLNAKMDIWLSALPSLWLFSTGLIFSGLLPFAFYRKDNCYHRSFLIMRDAAKTTLNGTFNKDKNDEDRKRLSKITPGVLYWHKASIIFGSFASGLFLCGVFWPIVVLTFRIRI